MIDVSMTLSSERVIERLVVQGHADWAAKGSDIICSAFTVLLRTFVRSVEATQGIKWSTPVDRSGQFEMVVDGVLGTVASDYRAWCAFLLRGFDDLQIDAPQGVRLTVVEGLRRLVHGS